MRITSLRSLAIASGLCLTSVAFAKADLISKPAPMGDNTYSISVEAPSAFQRDLDKLKQEATDAAKQYCADQGKVMKVVSLTGKVPMFSTGYAHAKIVFKALAADDPELTAPVAAPGQPMPAYAGQPMPAYVPPGHLTTDQLYDQLTKLDDLRKKGILTDDEFQAEKKKLLSRSN
jgi:hypothetical protein